MFKKTLAGFAASAAVVAGLGLSAAAASAAPTPFPATLSSSGVGAHAVWNTSVHDSVKLTVGTPSSSTFGEAKILDVPSAVPASEPVFVTDHYAAGSPRIVIELNDGSSLVGYPAASHLNGTDMAWAVGNSGTYTSYATARHTASLLPGSFTVKDVFIVADGDQVAGTTDTISAVQYDGRGIVPVRTGHPTPPPSSGYTIQAKGHVQSEQSHLYLTAVDGKMVQEPYSGSSDFAMVQNNSSGLTGLEVLNSHGQLTGNFVNIPDSGQATVVNHFVQTSKHGSYYSNASGYDLNNSGWSTAPGNHQIGWAAVRSGNEQYTSPGQ